MNDNLDRCNKLRKLHEHLLSEMHRLSEEVAAMEREGVGNPTGTRSIIKSLQASLHTIHLELQNCPPEKRPDESPASAQHSEKSIRYTEKAFVPDEEKAAASLESEESVLDTGD